MKEKSVYKVNRSELFRLLSYGKRRFPSYLVGILGENLISIGFKMLMAFVLKDMVNAAVQGNVDLLVKAGLMVIAGAVMLNVISPFFSYLKGSCGAQTANDIVLIVYKHVIKLPAAYFDRHHSGDIMSRLNNDVGNMSGVFEWMIGSVFYMFFNGLGSIGVVVILDWRLGMIAIVAGIVSALLNLKFARLFQEMNRKKNEYLGKLSEKLIDILAGFNTMKMFHLEEKLLGFYGEYNQEAARISVRRGKAHSAMESAVSSMNYAAFILVIAFGAILVMKKQLSFGTVIAVTYLLGDVTGIFTRVSNSILWILEHLAGATRVFDLLDEGVEPDRYEYHDEEPCMTAAAGSVIEFRKVCFNYGMGERVLDSLSLTVEEGKMAALVGSSGGGKSTIIKLLLGYYPWQVGDIRISGKSFSEYSISELRSLMAYVPQDPYLFDGTIEENIRYGKLDATREEIEAAARTANAHEFILEQPEGYATAVGERGVRLSGGQKQRIAIARAVLKNAPILLLDEATSSLDSENEQLVQDALNKLMAGRTTVVVAHRLSTIEKADVIYVVNDGAVIENGTHRELLSVDGVYKGLYEMQFREQIEEISAV